MNTLRTALRLTVLLALQAGVAGAAPDGDTLQQYSHLVPVSTSGHDSVFQLPLPRAVYQYARSRDLDDLRLFDRNGNALPFSLVEQDRAGHERRATTPAAVFPVYGPLEAEAATLEGLQVRTTRDGAVVSINTTAGGARQSGDVLVGLVLDMRHGSLSKADAAAPVTALVLELPEGEQRYNAELLVDVSDDLQEWEPVAQAPVSWLVNAQGLAVRQNRIEFPSRAVRYARIRWVHGAPLAFTRIGAERRLVDQVPLRWEYLTLQPAPGKAANDLVYRSPIAIPAQTVGLVLGDTPVVVSAQLGQYASRAQRNPNARAGADLVAAADATFMRLTQDGRQHSVTDVGVPLRHADHWVLRPKGALSGMPALRLGWTPATMVFVAAGPGPYTLAFGRSDARSARTALPPEIMRQGPLASARATAGEPVLQAAAARVDPAGADRTRASWLWAVLLIGVAALGMMAWRLGRQLKSERGDTPSS